MPSKRFPPDNPREWLNRAKSNLAKAKSGGETRYPGLSEPVTEQEYREFLRTHEEVVIESKAVKLITGGKIALLEPPEFKLEKTTVWSFENRGKWATHRGNYRGNWAPEIPRNLILRYIEPGEVVLWSFSFWRGNSNGNFIYR